MKIVAQFLIAVALSTGFVATSEAHVTVGIGIGVPVYPTYAEPPPVYYAPPPPVYYAPPIYPQVIIGGGYYGYRHDYGYHGGYGYRGGYYGGHGYRR